MKKNRENYMERQTWYHGNLRNWLCVECRVIFKKPHDGEWICPNCKGKLTFIGIFARAPRKNASDSKWKKFFKMQHIS